MATYSFETITAAQALAFTAGDTLTYSPRDPHTWRNPSEEEDAVVLWFTVPNPFSPAREGNRL